LTRSDGTTTDTYTYDAFGILIENRARDASGNLVVVAPGSSVLTVNSYLYCGEQFDPDLGLYFLRARYLNAGSGRFWTVDTLPGVRKDPFSLHKYLYTRADPVNHFDPSGQETEASQLANVAGLDYLATRIGIAVGQAYARLYITMGTAAL